MTARAQGRLADADGFTLIEVLVAIVMVVLVFAGLALLFAEANDSSLASQRQISRLTILEQQIEKVRDTVSEYGFSALALSGNPAAPTDGGTLPANPTDPDDFITSSGLSSEAFLVESNYNNTPEGVISTSPSTGEPLLAPVTGVTGGQVAPVQCADLSTGTTYADPASGATYPSCSTIVPSGDPYSTVYTYVTQATAAGCNTALGSCGSDVRRVVVAAVNYAPGPSSRNDLGPTAPTYATTIITNPAASNQATTASGLKILGLIS